jgi:hypothetical protein
VPDRREAAHLDVHGRPLGCLEFLRPLLHSLGLSLDVD